MKTLRFGWTIARPFLIAYLLVVLAMLFLENWLVYPAPPIEWGDWNAKGLGHEDIWFLSDDGTKLHGWYVPHPKPKRAILYCHGNGEHIGMNVDLAARLRDTLDASVFLFDYRGYGHSAGSPTESGCIADGLAAQRWLAQRVGLRPSQIVVMGRSLGGAVAVALAASEGASALVVENSFATMPEIAANRFSWLPVRSLMRNRYDSLSRIVVYQGPFMQSHGTADEIVPISAARQLFDAAANPSKRWIQFAGLGHNSPWPAHYYAELSQFLDSTLPSNETATRGANP